MAKPNNDPSAHTERGAADAAALEHPDPAVRSAANGELNARISAAASAVSFADKLAERGQAVVVMEGGRMVRRNPDGTTATL